MLLFNCNIVRYVNGKLKLSEQTKYLSNNSGNSDFVEANDKNNFAKFQLHPPYSFRFFSHK